MLNDIKILCHDYEQTGILNEKLTQRAKDIFGSDIVKAAYLVSVEDLGNLVDMESLNVINTQSNLIAILFVTGKVVAFSSGSWGYIAVLEWEEIIKPLHEHSCKAKSTFGFLGIVGEEKFSQLIQKEEAFTIKYFPKEITLNLKETQEELVFNINAKVAANIIRKHLL